ncbi:MAG: hypothetical protein JWO38_1159, partial [Gemmataceae bacterium]|nr:hypothetical protein [Gemmataceae bacterium]
PPPAGRHAPAATPRSAPPAPRTATPASDPEAETLDHRTPTPTPTPAPTRRPKPPAAARPTNEKSFDWTPVLLVLLALFSALVGYFGFMR